MKKINFDKIKKNKEKISERKVIKRKKEKDPVEKVTKKRKHFRIWYWLLIIIVFFAILLFIGGVGFAYYVVKSAPEFNVNKMFEKEASRIFDSEGNIIATLGAEQRQKITYNDIPDVLVDAIVATEDSRFYQHKGFDLPRFAKASLGQLLGQNSGGASTLTMQLSKLAFTSMDADGIKGIIRKFTDIYMAVFKLEKNLTKEQIIEYYVNTPCLGGNIYGVKQAASYYFDKDISDLNLVEAAMIAGMFQSPNGYNPFINPNDANARKNTVLYLMKRHGYITEEEYKAGTSVEIKNLLGEGKTSVNQYQGFVDTVVQEVIDKTDTNPYDVPMDIYSTMVKSKQDVINNFYKTYSFKDEKVEVGIGAIDVKTGAIVAVGAGRNKNGAMTLNVATFSGQTKRHPGSTIKPIMDYGPAFEYASLSTYGPFIDEKTPYGGGYMRNFSGSYTGFMTTKKCLASSINTCALQAFGMTTNEQKIDFITGLGIYPEEGIEVLPQSYSIGAFNGVSPVQLAGAYAAFASGGYYTAPYSFTKVVYRETEEEYEQDISRERAMTPQTAYLITSILVGATNSRVRVSGTQIATKTGTTSYDDNLLKSFGLRSSVIPDSWTSSYTPDYAVAIWYGYVAGLTTENVKNKWYLINGEASNERFKIQAAVVNDLYNKNSKFTSPGGISSSNVELETIPAQKPSDYTPGDLKGSFLFISGTEPSEVSTRFSKLSDPQSPTYSTSGNTLNLSWTSPGTPSAVDIGYLTDYFKNGYSIWADDYLNKRISYNNSNIGTFGFAIYLTQGTSSTYVGWTENTTYSIDLSSYSGVYDGVIIKSTYSKFKSNSSNGTKIVFETGGNGEIDESKISVTMEGLNANYSVGASFSELNSASISSIKYNSTEVKSGVTNLSVITGTVTKDGDTSWSGAPRDITNAKGTYRISYSVSFVYSGKSISKTITQTVAVN